MLPSGRTENTPGSVPFGIQENVTRSSITRKNGRSAAFLAALTGKSAALAKPVDASAANDSAAATIAVFRKDILTIPKLTSERSGPLTRQLRRSRKLRSLNFSQSLPHV